MSFPRYPEYKPSGVEWLGEVPGHWGISRLRSLTTVNPSKSEVNDLAADTLVSFLPMEAIGEDGRLRLDIDRPLGELGGSYTYLRDGDVAVAKITPCFENGKGALMCGLRGGIAFGTTELIVLRPRLERVLPPFLFYLTRSLWFLRQGEGHMYGAGGQKRVPDEFVRSFPVGVPPLPEQHAIAAFLDCETARIDALVNEQERLIELLREKRQAVISHAVTKGLDATVPMKDSGVRWLDAIPAHWNVKRLRYVSPRLAGRLIVQPHQFFVDDGVPILFGNNIGRGVLLLDGLKFISYEADARHAHCRVRAGDLLTVRVGDPGATAVVPQELDGCHFASAMLIRQSPNFDSRWLCHVMNSDIVGAQVNAVNYGAAQEQFNIGDAADFSLPVPPIEEQRQLSARIDEVVGSFDLLARESEHAITLLQERRAALISAAVTGQIDVRGLAPEATA